MVVTGFVWVVYNKWWSSKTSSFSELHRLEGSLLPCCRGYWSQSRTYNPSLVRQSCWITADVWQANSIRWDRFHSKLCFCDRLDSDVFGFIWILFFFFFMCACFDAGTKSALRHISIFLLFVRVVFSFFFLCNFLHWIVTKTQVCEDLSYFVCWCIASLWLVVLCISIDFLFHCTY